MFVRSFETTDVVKGSDIYLEGMVSGSAPFEICCYHGSKLIRNDKRHKILVENGTVTVQILKCEAGDAGEYQCTIANDVGESSCYYQITLKG